MADTTVVPKAAAGLSQQQSMSQKNLSPRSVRGFLSIALNTIKMLYNNEVTRGIGRDIVFFSGSVVAIRLLSSVLEEPLESAMP